METKTISSMHDFEKIIRSMASEFGTIEEIEEDHAMVMFAFESNLLKTNRRTGINNSRRASEAVKICLFNVKGYIEGCKYNTAPFSSPETDEYAAAIGHAFDPFINAELTEVVGRSYDLNDPNDLWAYFEMPVQCLLRIEKSIERLAKNQVLSGYFDFLEDQMGHMVNDDELHFTVMLRQNLPIDSDLLSAGQLTSEERDQFFAVWIPLLVFVNKRLSIIDFDITDENNKQNEDYSVNVQKIRDRLWEEPRLIGDYIESFGSSLPNEEISLLKSWHENHIEGQFVVVEYKFEHATFMRAEEGHEHEVYAVKGMSPLQYRKAWTSI